MLLLILEVTLETAFRSKALISYLLGKRIAEASLNFKIS